MVSRDLVGASTIPIVLAILSRGESYGYAILKEVEEVSGGRLAWSDAMLYQVLHRLEKRALVRSSWRPTPKGRDRKYYALTKKGEAELLKHRGEWKIVDATLEKLCEESPLVD